MFVKTARDNSVDVLVEPTPEDRSRGAENYHLQFGSEPIELDDTLGASLISAHPDLVETERPELETEPDPEPEPEEPKPKGLVETIKDAFTEKEPEPEPAPRIIKCGECEKVYKTRSGLSRHRKTTGHS